MTGNPVFQWLERVLVDEHERLPVWLPVFMGLGIGGYFALPEEPPLWLGGLLLGITMAVAWWLRSRLHLILAYILALTLVAVAVGFSAAQWRTASQDTVLLAQSYGPTSLSGRVVAAEVRVKDVRVTLDRLTIAGLRPDLAPRQARLVLRGKQPDLRPGDWLNLRGELMTPPEPAAPGAFDFQRQAFFQGLGAVGFAYGTAKVVARADEQAPNSWRLALEDLRRRLAERIRDSLSGSAGAVAAALMTGRRGAIPEADADMIRDAGLAHLLAISGLHIGLVSGIVFFSLRAVLALIAPLALNFPIKKWAAVAALLAGAGFALLTGAGVPTQRAFLMIALVLMAIVLDRQGLSLRSVALAATVVLLLQPESLLGPSFQMSFAAVIALITFYEGLRGRWGRRWAVRESAAPWRFPLIYLAGVALTTIVASLATAPFALYHFNRIAVYGLAANLVAVPVTALWVMPWALVAFLLMPLGLEGVALIPMGWGVEVVLWIARVTAHWPGAVSLVPAMSTTGLTAVALGGLWLTLWRGHKRWWGMVPLAAAALGVFTPAPPHVLINGEGSVMAVRGGDGEMAFSTLRRGRFDRETWLRRSGIEQAVATWRGGDKATLQRLGLRCDSLACVYRLAGEEVALIENPLALSEDCRRATVVISQQPVRRRCPSARLVIDRFDVLCKGAHALRRQGDQWRVDTVAADRGKRPWVAQRPTWCSPRPAGG